MLVASALPAPASLLEYLPEEWERLMHEWGQPAYRAKQIFGWLHRKGIFEPDRMSNLPPPVRERLREQGLKSPLSLERAHAGEDETSKLLFRLDDGQAIESVLMLHAASGSPGAVTLCVSSQVGCAMGCVFCASGLSGLKRQLAAAEILGQVLCAPAAGASGGRLRRRGAGSGGMDRNRSGEVVLPRRPRGLVFMGMGEPLHNYGNLARALLLLTHPEGMAFPFRAMTVSTSGLAPEIRRLGRDFEGRVQLAVSLHAADDETRSRLVPLNRRYPIEVLVEAMRSYPVPRRGHLTVEYTLIKGTNASLSDARRLARLLRGMRVRVNLIPMNPVEGSRLRAPDQGSIARFQNELRNAGMRVFVRRRRGDRVAAACGQLALRPELQRLTSPRALQARHPLEG